MEWFEAHPPHGCVTSELVLILLAGCMEFHLVGMTTSSPPVIVPVSQDRGCALCEASFVFPERSYKQTSPHRLLKPGWLLHPQKKGARGGAGLRLVTRGPRATLVLVFRVPRPISSQREDGALAEIGDVWRPVITGIKSVRFPLIVLLLIPSVIHVAKVVIIVAVPITTGAIATSTPARRPPWSHKNKTEKTELFYSAVRKNWGVKECTTHLCSYSIVMHWPCNYSLTLCFTAIVDTLKTNQRLCFERNVKHIHCGIYVLGL